MIRQGSFPPACRMRHRRAYLVVQAQGRKRHTRHFVVIVMQKTDGPTRLGLTVSRKIGGAVQRNLVKRRLREFFRLNYHRLPAAVDISLIAKTGAALISMAQIREELGFLLDGKQGSGLPCSVDSSLSQSHSTSESYLR